MKKILALVLVLVLALSLVACGGGEKAAAGDKVVLHAAGTENFLKGCDPSFCGIGIQVM